MTIKVPVDVDLLETTERLAWRIVDATGRVVPWGVVVEAINAPVQTDPSAAMRVARAIDALRAEGPSADDRIAAALVALEGPPMD